MFHDDLGTGFTAHAPARRVVSLVPSITESLASVRAEALAGQLDDSRLKVLRIEAQQAPASFDLVINATSASLQNKRPELPESIIGKETLACDLVYADRPTPFMEWAEKLGARTADGWGMLVEQAAESFRIWHGIRPDTTALLRH